MLGWGLPLLPPWRSTGLFFGCAVGPGSQSPPRRHVRTLFSRPQVESVTETHASVNRTRGLTQNTPHSIAARCAARSNGAAHGKLAFTTPIHGLQRACTSCVVAAGPTNVFSRCPLTKAREGRFTARSRRRECPCLDRFRREIHACPLSIGSRALGLGDMNRRFRARRSSVEEVESIGAGRPSAEDTRYHNCGQEDESRSSE